MNRMALIILMLPIFVGCASVSRFPLTIDAAKTLQGKTIQKSQYEKADFRAMTPGKAIFIGGMVGAVSFVLAGNKIVEENSIDDPALGLSEKIVAAMSKKHGLSILNKTPVISRDDDIQTLISDNSGSDLILDIKTQAWGFRYFPTDWDNYQVFYRARLRFIEVSERKVLAEGECFYDPKYADTNTALSYDALVDKNAKGLKNELAKATLYCEELFKEKLLGL